MNTIRIAAPDRRRHEKWLREVTVLSTAAGREQNVIAWIERWVSSRKSLRMSRDRAGNLIIAPEAGLPKRPIYITAHLDHPAFVVTAVNDRTIELEFRGGVNDPYFAKASIDVFDSRGRAHRATITALDAKAQPFKRVTARLTESSKSIAPGDVGRWRFAGKLPRVAKGMIYTHACDDLAAVAAALGAYETLAELGAANVGLLFTRSEEIGFIGAIAACKLGTVPKDSRLICLENSRSFADSPIGAGPIVRVGDRISVFDPRLTNRISAIMTEYAKASPKFKWQRKLMAGGACEATTFSTYGFESTCLCLPLGNYHNMADIDGVNAGKRPARVGPEFVSLNDYHGLIEMLVVSCTQLDSAAVPDIRERMESLIAKHSAIVGM